MRDGASRKDDGSLRAIVDRLRGNPRVHIMHNADDILAERTAIEELKALMGDQMTVYPYGGHLGNLWYADNQEDILRFFRTPVAPSVQASSPGPASSAPDQRGRARTLALRGGAEELGEVLLPELRHAGGAVAARLRAGRGSARSGRSSRA